MRFLFLCDLWCNAVDEHPAHISLRSRVPTLLTQRAEAFAAITLFPPELTLLTELTCSLHAALTVASSASRSMSDRTTAPLHQIIAAGALARYASEQHGYGGVASCPPLPSTSALLHAPSE